MFTHVYSKCFGHWDSCLSDSQTFFRKHLEFLIWRCRKARLKLLPKRFLLSTCVTMLWKDYLDFSAFFFFAFFQISKQGAFLLFICCFCWLYCVLYNTFSWDTYLLKGSNLIFTEENSLYRKRLKKTITDPAWGGGGQSGKKIQRNTKT